METIDTATEKTWDEDLLMKGSNGEVVMAEPVKSLETTATAMPVSIFYLFTEKYNLY